MIVLPAYWNWMKNAWMFLLAFLLIAFFGCNSETKIYTVGIASWNMADNRTLNGFKGEMVKRGYVEGENVRYIYEFIPVGEFYNVPFIKAKLKDFLTQDMDLLLTLGREVSLAAKNLVEGTDIPVLFFGNRNPVEDGLVESLLRPGGNLTGVRFANSIPKALEWLVRVTGAKKVYVPYCPSDSVSIECLKGIDEIAAQLRVELVLGKVHSVEEAARAIENLPADFGAVFRIPSPLLDPRSIEISQAGIRRRIAMCASHQVDNTILATFASNEFAAGEMLARLAQQIDQGAEPSDLQVETVDVFLTINLKTAKKIGLGIPNDVLTQAKKIIR